MQCIKWFYSEMCMDAGNETGGEGMAQAGGHWPGVGRLAGALPSRGLQIILYFVNSLSGCVRKIWHECEGQSTWVLCPVETWWEGAFEQTLFGQNCLWQKVKTRDTKCKESKIAKGRNGNVQCWRCAELRKTGVGIASGEQIKSI
jgi:hypothetical protein